MNDEPDTLYGNPATAFATLTTLKVQVLRVNLYWGGNKWAVANKKPTDATIGDPPRLVVGDRLVQYATPDIRSSSRSRSSFVGQRQGEDCRPTAVGSPELAYAAAGVQRLLDPPSWQMSAGIGDRLPKVSMWTAWNWPTIRSGSHPVQEDRQDVAGRERLQLCQDLQRDLHGHPLGRDLGEPGQDHRREGRLWGHRPEGERRSRNEPRIRRSAHVPQLGQEVRDEDLRRLRAPSVCVVRRGAPELRAHGEGQAPRPARQHRLADDAAYEALRAEAPLAHGVRLPDESARPDHLRSQLGEAGAVHEAGVRDGACEPADRHDALVPRTRRAEHRRLAVAPRPAGEEEALVGDAHRCRAAGLERLVRRVRRQPARVERDPYSRSTSTSRSDGGGSARARARRHHLRLRAGSAGARPGVR